MSSPLERLPNELLDQIISYLDIDPPSRDQLYQEPDHDITVSQNKSLKYLSESCSRLAGLVRPCLFTHARLVLHDEPSLFGAFVRKWDLARHIKFIVIRVSDKQLPRRIIGRWLTRLFEFIDPLWMTIAAPPRIIGEALKSAIDERHGWAFGIDQQILQLQQSSYGNPTAYHPPASENIFCVRPWTSIFFNEGSSLKAYNHYEYFLSQVPSVLGQWGQDFSQLQHSRDLSSYFEGIESLTYTAIFPFYNHVDNVCFAMQLLPRLRVVTVQLAPDENNHATELEQRGSMDPNDPWMELESSYSVIGFRIRMQASVMEFRTRDMHVEAVQPELTKTLSEQLRGWTHDGLGIWRRPPPDETS